MPLIVRNTPFASGLPFNIDTGWVSPSDSQLAVNILPQGIWQFLEIFLVIIPVGGRGNI